MNTSSRNILAGLTLVAAGIAVGWAVAQWRAGHLSGSPAANVTVASAPTERKVLYWYDPMVPTQKFDKPGKSPYMDMPLMPKYADEDTQDSTGLSVSAQAVQALGLRTAEVLQGKIGADVNVVGTVLLNDRDVSIVQARTAGFVERVYARAAGDVIAAGAPLADLLLPEWIAAQREFLSVRAMGDAPLTAAARQRLLLLGMPQALIAQVERTGEPKGLYTVTTPQGGLVAELMVRQGMTVSAGESLARVNGLATVWIEAAVPEAQSGPLQVGQTAQVRLAAFPGEVLQARIVSILPEANRDTRTVRVRLEMANPDQGRGGRRSAGGQRRARGGTAGRGLGAVPDRLGSQPAGRAACRCRGVRVCIGAQRARHLVATGRGKQRFRGARRDRGDVAHRTDAGARGRAGPPMAGHDHGLRAEQPAPRRGSFGSAAGAIHLL